MRYRKLGSSDLEVSEISLGSWLTYSGGVESEQTRACTDAAFEAGINFFDTANVYGRGASETAWGEILSARPREFADLVLKQANGAIVRLKDVGRIEEVAGDSSADIFSGLAISTGMLKRPHYVPAEQVAEITEAYPLIFFRVFVPSW